MNKEEALKALIRLHREANKADSQTAKGWQKPGMAKDWCRAIEKMMSDLTPKWSEALEKSHN